MADKKISALTAATTPLAGTEVLPIVQSGSTVKVSIADVTAGRSVSASGIVNSLGAVGTPSYTFTGDLNTGMWSPAADTIAMSTAGAERMRLTSAGDLGIGTSSPTAKLDVNGQLNVPDQLAYDFTTSVLPDIAPTLNLNFVGANAVDPRITFTRSTTATYYDSDTTALAEQNLVTYSQEFDNAAWVKTSVTATANSTTAPDGTLTADTFTDDATNGPHISVESATPAVAGQTYTLSLYAKASTASVIQVTGRVGTMGTNVWANFNLATGAVGTVGSSTTASIVSVGSGWYRCIVTGVATGSGAGVMALILTNNDANAGRQPSYAGTGTSVFIWGAQVEQRTVATAYNVTTTTAITNYIPQLMTAAINQPRLDFDPVTRAPKGFLIEEARTNLLTYSSEFDNAAWTKSNATITANATTAPDGTVTADKLVENTVNTAHYILQGTGTVGASETFSFYAKAGGRNWAIAQMGNNGVAYYDLANGALGTVSNATATITSVGNGWYRCSITATRSSNQNNIIYPATANGTSSYTGDGWSGIFIWGTQVEAGTFATSYIPTVATTVQRTADNAVMTGTNFSSWYNQASGTIVADYATFIPVSQIVTSTPVSFAINDGTANNSIHSFSAAAAPGLTRGTVAVGGATQAAMDVTPALLSGKVALAYTTNDFAFSAGGSAAVVDTSGSVPTVNSLQLGRLGGAATLNGWVRSLRYYPVRLTNATLQALTA